MCDECTWHHKTVLVQLYRHWAIRLYCSVSFHRYIYRYIICQLTLYHWRPGWCQLTLYHWRPGWCQLTLYYWRPGWCQRQSVPEAGLTVQWALHPPSVQPPESANTWQTDTRCWRTGSPLGVDTPVYTQTSKHLNTWMTETADVLAHLKAQTPAYTQTSKRLNTWLKTADVLAHLKV